MSYKKLPKGAKQVTQWAKHTELNTESYDSGYTFGSQQSVFVEYDEAQIEYPNGNNTPILAYATRVSVYRTNGTGLKRVYRQAFYGETAEDDARREAGDHVSKLLYAKA